MNIDVEIFGQSVASLDADLIDLDGIEELEDAVYVAASNLCNNDDLDISEIVAVLKRSIAGIDNNEFALLLTKTTNVDWLYDKDTMETMKLMTEKLLEGIEYYTMSNR